MNFDTKYVQKFVKNSYDLFEDKVKSSDNLIKSKQCLGNEMLGWKNLKNNVDLNLINKVTEEINSSSDCIIVIGIGGSYLGAKMAIEFLNSCYKESIYFLGHNLDSEYTLRILRKCENKSVHVVIVSKSGNTIEIKSTLDIILQFMKKKYGNCLEKRFTSITGQSGYIKDISVEKGWTTLDIPGDVGGRFSVLTNVGMLVSSLAGANVSEILDGALEMQEDVENPNSDCHKYAIVRSALYELGFKVELFSSFSTRMISSLEWIKQLFGESEGKDSKGLFPASAFFSTDLHSLGQFIQEGSKILFESMVFCQNFKEDLKISKNCSDKFLREKSFNSINKKIFESVSRAHFDGGIPCGLINLDNFEEKELGRFIYFFEYACALSAVTLGVNPFNQPGVEVYKREIFK